MRTAAKIALTWAGTLLVLLACGHPAETPSAAPSLGGARPNVILIVADDLGYGDLCAYGCSGARTPNLDALARGGIRFTAGYVTAPVCSPTRAALLSGRYQQRFGHEFAAGGIERTERDGLGTPTDEVLLPELLQRAGYATGMVGKWHLGSRARFHPMARGFDEFFGFLHGGNLYVASPDHPGLRSIFASMVAPPDPEFLKRRPPINAILRGREPVHEERYLTEAFTEESLDFIDRHAEVPFFLYLAYNAPHTPLQVTDEYYDRFPHIADERHRIYAAMVSALDDGIGAIGRKLEELEIEERTLVLFLSDNGCATYVEACFNDPLMAGKMFHFEGGVRVPFLLRWPGRVAASQQVDTPVSSLDIFPTLLELAATPAADARELDGLSLLPLLRGEELAAQRALYWRSGANSALRSGDWKLIRIRRWQPAPGADRERTFLFDLAHDPGERTDLSRARPDVVADLLDRFETWSAGMVEPLWPPVRRSGLELRHPADAETRAWDIVF